METVQLLLFFGICCSCFTAKQRSYKLQSFVGVSSFGFSQTQVVSQSRVVVAKPMCFWYLILLFWRHQETHIISSDKIMIINMNNNYTQILECVLVFPEYFLLNCSYVF